jgi:hypothetical protein
LERWPIVLHRTRGSEVVSAFGRGEEIEKAADRSLMSRAGAGGHEASAVLASAVSDDPHGGTPAMSGLTEP